MSNKMESKIALLVPNLAGGGAERVMVILANEFSHRISNVDLIIVNDEDMHYFSELSDKVNLINLKKRRLISAIFSIRRYLRSEKPEAMITTLKHVTAAAAIARLISGRVRTRLYPREDGTPQRFTIQTPYLYFLDLIVRQAYSSSPGIISLSHGMSDQIIKHYKTKAPIHTIYNPIYFADILAKADAPIKPCSHFDPSHDFVLAVGRLTPVKGFDVLLQAFALARAQHDIKLVILGEGPEEAALMELARELNIQDSLYMPGFVANPFAYMRAARAFVLSSVSEGLPNSLIQALVCGTPCVATNCPTGPKEVLGNGKFGTLVDVGDYRAMSSAIINIMNGEVEAKPTMHQLREKYDATKIAESYLKVVMQKD